MDVCNYKVRERMRNGKPEGFRDFFENFMTDKKDQEGHNLDYSEILRESNILIAAGNVRSHSPTHHYTTVKTHLIRS
jgi:hypothetical protein